jgi:hypothetical protein
MNTDSFSFTSNFPVSPLARYNNKNLQFSHVPGRTMKRFRDNRPSEYEVHRKFRARGNHRLPMKR